MNNILAWFNPGRWLMLLAAVLALTAGYFAWADHIGDVREAKVTARYETALTKQKAEARTKLADEKEKTAAAEKALADFKNGQEIKDAKNRNTVAGLERRLRDAAGPAGRLRDPNAAGCGGGGGGATSPAAAGAVDRAADPGEGAGLLSEPLTRLLQRITREADEINAAYISCRADALSARDLTSTTPKGPSP